MGKNTRSGVPAVGGSRDAVVTNTRHRKNALVGQALDIILDDPKRRDPAAALAERYWADPQAFIDWLQKHTGGDDIQPGAGIAAAAGAAFAGIFAGAAAQAAAARAAEPEPIAHDHENVIDVTASEVGVQSGLDHEQAVDW